MPTTTIPRGSAKGLNIATAVLSPASVANATSAEQTFTISGLALNDYVYVNKPTAQAGLGISGCRVSAANTLAITFMNATAATITPTASETYTVLRVTPETNPPLTVL